MLKKIRRNDLAPAAKIVLAGEVDCGKSTLLGRLLYDTDSVSSQAKEELGKVSKELGKNIEFAYLLDSFQEERSNEFTLDTTQALLKTKGRNYVLIDVPGHRQLLKNMLTGSSCADAAILIIDIQKGLQEQTRRHGYILKFLGISELIVVVTKMDLISYNRENFEVAQKQAEVFLKDLGLKAVATIPVSAKEGENLFGRSSRMHWYWGLTLIEALNTTAKKEHSYDFRFPVQDIYEFKSESVVVGTIVSGELKKGDKVIVSPSGIELEVETIRSFKKDRPCAVLNESIGLSFREFPLGIKRGQVLYKGKPPRVSSEIRAKIFCLSPFSVKERLVLICATEEVVACVNEIKGSVDTATFETGKDLKSLKEHDAAEVAISTEEPLIVENFSDVSSLGRFIIEKNNEVCGIGIIC